MINYIVKLFIGFLFIILINENFVIVNNVFDNVL